MHRSLGWLLFCWLALPAWAGRPLATEDAGVLERGDCELESFAARERAPASPRVTTLSVQAGCGIGWNTQVAASVAREREAGERSRLVGLVGKTGLRALTDTDYGVTLAYSLQWTRLPGDQLRRSSTEVKGVLTIPVRDWLVHANLGPAYDHRARQWSTGYGLALERPGALGPLDLMGEVFGTDRERATLQLGVRWPVVPDRLFLDASIGRQLASDGVRLLSVGIKHAF